MNKEELKRIKEIIIEATDETQKEHGEDNVYIDMVGELILEKILELNKKEEKPQLKCRQCNNKFNEDFCSTNDVGICRWCSGEEV